MERKILKIMVLLIIIILSISIQVLTISKKIEVKNTNIKIADLSKIEPDSWKPTGEEGSQKFNTKIGKILGAIRNFGIVTSVIALMIIGLRTMIGSIEEKSHYKESLPTFLIGVFILLAGTTIPDIIYKIASTF